MLKIVVPKTTDAASRRLIQEFSERNPYNPRAGCGDAVQRPHSPDHGRIIPRDLVARELAVSTKVLLRYESLGLVRMTRAVGRRYEPGQIRRLWSIVSFQRDLGINLAGVEVILRLFDHLAHQKSRVHQLTVRLRELIDDAERESPIDADE